MKDGRVGDRLKVIITGRLL